MKIMLCLVLTSVFQTASAATPVTKPNIIVIYTDDHGYADLGSQGVFKDLKTPNIDALAASGVRATNGYSTAPQCVPSRAGLMVGRYQNRFGVESNGKELVDFDAQKTIAERLKEAGYATGMAGKWHLGPDAQIPTHGFDHAFPMNNNGSTTANITLEGKDQPMGTYKTPLYHLDACSRVAGSFIKHYQDRPFFFYLAFRAPHVPLDAPQSFLDRFPGEMPERRRQALAMISAMDDGVGRIVDTLRELKLTERTLIFFIADNGAPLKIHKKDAPGGGPGWNGSLNDPLNGEKGTLAEGGIRVPFVVAWPGTIPAGQVYHQPVIALDVAATSVELAGLERDPLLDGVNLIPFLTEKQSGSPHEYLTWRWGDQAAIREGNWKYLRGGAREYLFDLDTDLGESKNLLASQPEIAKQLSVKLNSWGAELQPPGIETKGGSPAMISYFDHYLDHKPTSVTKDLDEEGGTEKRPARRKGVAKQNATKN